MGISLQNYFYFFRVNHFSRIITNDSAYIKYEISTLVWSLLDYRLQFMRYAMKALRCNGFVDGPVSLQLTGHPFAKPHVPCVVASQLCFVHERASTSSCWSVKFLCKHEICPDLAWRVNFYIKKYPGFRQGTKKGGGLPVTHPAWCFVCLWISLIHSQCTYS